MTRPSTTIVAQPERLEHGGDVIDHTTHHNEAPMRDTIEFEHTSTAPGVAPETTPTRQCGRCRLHFPIDADTHPMELGDWWACPACLQSLLPGRRVPTSHDERQRLTS